MGRVGPAGAPVRAAETHHRQTPQGREQIPPAGPDPSVYHDLRAGRRHPSHLPVYPDQIRGHREVLAGYLCGGPETAGHSLVSPQAGGGVVSPHGEGASGPPGAASQDRTQNPSA